MFDAQTLIDKLMAMGRHFENCNLLFTEGEEPFSDYAQAAYQAAAIVMNDEPRLMGIEEVIALDWDYCYLEQLRLPGKEYRSMLGEHILTCVTWPSITAAKITYGLDGYGKTWRCWTSRPTDEMRRDAPWAPKD